MKTLPPFLTDLNLSWVNITDVALPALSAVTSLTKLDLSWRPNHLLTGAGIKLVANLPNLIDLCLYQCTSTTDEAVQALAARGILVSLGRFRAAPARVARRPQLTPYLQTCGATTKSPISGALRSQIARR